MLLKADKCVVDGASESLQLLDVAAFMMRQWSTSSLKESETRSF